MCKLIGHWVPNCADGLAGQSVWTSDNNFVPPASVDTNGADGGAVWVSDYTFVSAEQAGSVDARGVNLVGVGDPENPHNPDFIAAETTLFTLSEASSDSSSQPIGSASASVGTNASGASAMPDASGEWSGIASDAQAIAEANGSFEWSGSGSVPTTGPTVTQTASEPSGSAGSADTSSETTTYIELADTASGQQSAPAAGPTINLTTTQAGQQITRDGYHWGSSIGHALTISFGFRTSMPSYSVSGEDVKGTFTAFSAAEETAARAALAYWGTSPTSPSSISAIAITPRSNSAITRHPPTARKHLHSFRSRRASPARRIATAMSSSIRIMREPRRLPMLRSATST
jgi:hypothetical protein